MELSKVKTIDLVAELATRTGVTRKKVNEIDLTLSIPSLDEIDDTKTFEFSFLYKAEELINQAEIILDHIRDGWQRVDHWVMGDDLIVVLSPPKDDEAYATT